MHLPGYRPVTTQFALPAILLVIAAGCTKNAPPSAPPPGVTAVTPVAATNDFVGSEECGKCHTAEWQSHRTTRHAHTFRPMTVSALGKSAPINTRFTDANCAVARDGDHYMLINPQTGQARPLHYALGSGKQGLTFIATEETGVFEMRMSYIPRTEDWYATPGQEKEVTTPDATGKLWKGDVARACILCHAVKISSYGLYPDPQFMGVGCESCHGPGSAHIAAVKSQHPTADKMENLHNAGGKQINTLCGKCHRTPEDTEAMPAKQRLSQRFMPYGLAKSRCFQQSNDRLTCITCHTPHENAGAGHKSYERICLNCHSGNTVPHNAQAGSTAALMAARKSVCPVNPRTGCIGCHMPTKSVFTGNGNPIPIAMADHYIRINRKGGRD